MPHDVREQDCFYAGARIDLRPPTPVFNAEEFADRLGQLPHPFRSEYLQSVTNFAICQTKRQRLSKRSVTRTFSGVDASQRAGAETFGSNSLTSSRPSELDVRRGPTRDQRLSCNSFAMAPGMVTLLSPGVRGYRFRERIPISGERAK